MRCVVDLDVYTIALRGNLRALPCVITIPHRSLSSPGQQQHPYIEINVGGGGGGAAAAAGSKLLKASTPTMLTWVSAMRHDLVVHLYLVLQKQCHKAHTTSYLIDC